MANLNVTYDQMQSAATRLRNGQKDLESKLNELRSLVQQLSERIHHVARLGRLRLLLPGVHPGCDPHGSGNRRHGRLPEQGCASSPADRRGTGTSSR